MTALTASRDLSIRSIEAIPVEIPLARPIKWARGQMNTIDNVIIRVTLADGTQGIADAPSRPTILGDTQKSIAAIVAGYFAPALVGVNVFDMQKIWSVFGAYAGNAAAKAAIDLACHDAQGKVLGVPCANLLGGVVKPLPVNWRLALGTDKEMLDDATQMMAKYGFRALKVKCGLDPARDVRFLRSLRKEVGDDVEITIDCNQSYSSQLLLETLPAFEEVNIALIEEPIPARDGKGKLLCSNSSRIPISGDDSCFTPDDVLHELELGAIRAVVIKIARNGYWQGRDIVSLCRSHYVPAHNGSQGDMHIGSAAAGHFACSYRSVHAHEFSSFLDAADFVCDRNLEIKDGHLVLPEGPGIGLALDAAKLAKYRIDR